MYPVHFSSTVVLAVSIALGSAAAIAHAQESSTPEITSFASTDDAIALATPEEAVEAFKAALWADDGDNFARLLGLDSEKLRASQDAQQAFQEIREGAGKQVRVVDEGLDRKVLQIGAKLWPFPFPLVKGDDGQWSFDTFAGFQEIISRRIGENELQAIETMRAYVDAQKEYALEDRDGDGVLEFAQRLVSSEGMTDGLYWPADQGDGESPAGAGINQAELTDAMNDEGYFGYRFRPLLAQGDNVAGGRYDYMINGNMIAGFGLIAWPVRYGESGVHVFIVNQHGTVYETDLGPATETIVKYIDRFDPEDSWQVVND